MRESGAITVALRDVRNSIGKDRQQWYLALESELQSLRDTGAIETVKHVPRNQQVLPMKVVPRGGLTRSLEIPNSEYAVSVVSAKLKCEQVT